MYFQIICKVLVYVEIHTTANIIQQLLGTEQLCCQVLSI